MEHLPSFEEIKKMTQSQNKELYSDSPKEKEDEVLREEIKELETEAMNKALDFEKTNFDNSNEDFTSEHTKDIEDLLKIKKQELSDKNIDFGKPSLN